MMRIDNEEFVISNSQQRLKFLKINQTFKILNKKYGKTLILQFKCQVVPIINHLKKYF